jgi:anti-anti-sigma factor
MIRTQPLVLALEPQTHPQGFILRLKGAFQESSMAEVSERLGGFLELHGKGTFILDFTHCSSVCASGWGMVLFAHHQIRKAGGKLVLTGLAGEGLATFEMLDLGELMDLYPDVESALRAAPAPTYAKIWTSIKIPRFNSSN